jgi:hypothetical protein
MVELDLVIADEVGDFGLCYHLVISLSGEVDFEALFHLTRELYHDIMVFCKG